jgi:excisionase family DNA binding protein
VRPDPQSVELTIPPELVELIAARAAELVAGNNGHVQDSWLNVAEAADYLRCTSSRIYSLVSARRIPFHKDGSRTLFCCRELDEWVRSGGARCPS